MTDADEAAIKEAFEFVEDDCSVSVTREGGGPSASDGTMLDYQLAAAAA